MASLKARLLGGWLGDRVLREARVTALHDLGAKFRRITLAGDSLRGISSAAGDKIQVFLPEVGARTYTPFAVDSDAGRLDLLAYLHGDGPGATWARALVPGATVRVLGPRDSIPLESLTRPIALFGDETSFAVARALLDVRAPDPAPATLLLEVSSRQECEMAREALDLPSDTLLERRGAQPGAFYADCAARLTRSLPTGGSLVLTGSARSIQQVRASLRSQAGDHKQKVKAYWSPGKRGLD
jgi:NADPH-dependent ferric siderophore reductase